ncbi:DUF1801 domain-containing protein [Dokdonella fugitiva]|nr:DUF1801 domain-containing protein [Dokdonella fugitiva]
MSRVPRRPSGSRGTGRRNRLARRSRGTTFAGEDMRGRLRRIPLDIRGLTGREERFRLSGAVKRDPEVDAWLSAEPADLRSIARTWFERMRACADDVRELMHDGQPTACVGDAAFAYVATFSAHVNVGFFHGAALADPEGLLQGTGKAMRHARLRPGQAIDDAALDALVRAAHADLRRRIEEGGRPR